MKSVVLYVENTVNAFTRQRYNDIKKDCGCDIYWCTSTHIPDENFSVFKTSNKRYNINYVEAFYVAHPEYERYFVFGSGFYYSGSISELISNLNSHPNVDLYASYVKKNSTEVSWGHFDNYLSTNPKSNITLLKSCLYSFVISNNGLKILTNCNDIIKTQIDELYVPTILYNNGCVIETLDSDMSESDREFCRFGLKYTNSSTFYYNVSFNDKSALNNNKNKIYCNYNSEKNNIDIDGWENVINENVTMSIVIPVYNAEEFLEECIESILVQTYTDFEIILVNDGSTDNTVSIIEKYKDNEQVLYYNKEHNGIAETLNYGIRKANGKYIVRMDSDDIMLPNRLEHQYNYMETHTNIDVLSSSMVWGNAKLGTPQQESCTLPERILSLTDFNRGNRLAHPCVIMRKDSLDKLPFLYEQYWEGCEDMKLWILCMQHGLTVASEPTDVIIYRQHEKQSVKVNTKPSKKINMWTLTDRVKRLLTPQEITKDLTVVIPFRNEGSEIERTVQNIRATSVGIPIILINDGSNDNYDYKWVADYFNCTYIENDESIGVAASRDLGVELSKTNYFVLLDGHMRFYDDNWDDIIMKHLKEHPKGLLTSMSGEIYKDMETNMYSNEYGDRKIDYTYGAYINLDEEGWEFTGKWTHRLYPKNTANDELITVSCVMGACYCASKEWWNYIGGLKGLHNWGQDEPLISLKTWMLGGEVLCMRKFFVGHLYRKKTPWRMDVNKIYSNSIYINHLFARNEDEAKMYDDRLKKRIGEGCFRNSMEIFNKYKNEYNKFKKYFDEHTTHSIDWFIENINDPVIAAKHEDKK